MAVAIRLTRVGATKRPAYRVIAIDKRRSRDGRALEILGYYDPLTEPATVRLETDKIKAWIGKGAQPSDTVVKLMRQAEATAKAGADAPTPKRATRVASAKPSRKAAAKAQTPAEVSETPAEAPARSSAAAPDAAEETAAVETPVEEAAPAADAVEDAPVEEAAATEAAQAPADSPTGDEPVTHAGEDAEKTSDA